MLIIRERKSVKWQWIIFFGIVLGLLSVLMFGCDGSSGPPPADAGPQMIFSDAPSIRIGWNEVTTDIQGNPEYIDHYDFYYRVRGDTEWTYYGEVPDIQDPWIEVWHDDLGNGEWEFGVNAIDVNGNVSELHSSVDGTAVPPEWYLRWITDPQSVPPAKPTGLTIVQ